MYSNGIFDNESGNVYIREKGALRRVNPTAPPSSRLTSSWKLIDREFSHKICINCFPVTECRKISDHFVFISNIEGSLRYMPRSLLHISMAFIADNIEHIDSLVGFPEQMAHKLFAAAEAKQKFADSSTSSRGLRVFSEAYGDLVLKSLCLRERSLLLSERMEEVRVFQSLETLDLHGCGLGDGHVVFSHLTSEACSRLVTLFLGDNRLSDEGLRKLTAPVRVMKRGLEQLQHLDLSSNKVTLKGLGYLTCFRKLRELNLSNTNVQLDSALKTFLRRKMSMVYSASPLQTFTHSECKTVGWAEQVINQWESKAAEIPMKNERPQTNALQFYGREKFVREKVLSMCNDSPQHEMTNIVHFHKLDLHTVSERTSDTPHTNLGGKRKFSRDQEEDTDTCSAAKRPLSVEDLELLGGY